MAQPEADHIIKVPGLAVGFDQSSGKYYPIAVGADGQIQIKSLVDAAVDVEVEILSSKQSVVEDTTETPLGAGASYTTPWFDIVNGSGISVLIEADQDGTHSMEMSHNQVCIQEVETHSYTANSVLLDEHAASARYVRMKFANGATPQTTFCHHTIQFTYPLKESIKIDQTSNGVSQSGNWNIQGEIAHSAIDSGNPIKMGGKARQSHPPAVSDGDRVDAYYDDLGRQVVTSGAPRDLVATNNITLTDATETTLLATGGAGVFHDLTLLTMSNTSASKVRVDIRDATAGTVLLSLELAADGGGAVIPMNIPMPQSSSNNNWTAQLSGAVTDVRIKAMAIKNV